MENHTSDDLFWSNVTKTATCWIWNGYKDSRGYGQVRRNGVLMYAHRYAMTLAGAQPGESVDHVCLVKSCVRVEHLRSATNKQNSENLSGAYANSKSGVRGVFWDKRAKQWRAGVGHNGQQYRKGFRSLEQATAWVVAKRLELFTHNDLDRV